MIIVGIIILSTSIVYINNRQNSPLEKATNQQQTKTYKSNETMDFTIEIPSDFKVDDQTINVTFSKDEGTIIITRSATEEENLSKYLANRPDRIEIYLKNKENLKIGMFDAISASYNKKHIYFIFVDGYVYSFSTDSDSLYSTLDQIAQSFRYTPN